MCVILPLDLEGNSLLAGDDIANTASNPDWIHTDFNLQENLL
jgi:hypothetical protein